MFIERGCFLLLLSTLFVNYLHITIGARQYFDGYQLYRVFMPSSAQFVKFRQWIDENEDLDSWHTSNHDPYFVDVAVGPQNTKALREYLANRNYTSQILVDNLKSIIHYETNNRKSRSNDQTGFYLERYNSLTEITKWLVNLRKNHEALVDLDEIGKTYEKRPILKVKIGRSARNHVKPSIWVDAGIHSREWLSISTSLYIINELITRYEKNDTVIVNLMDRVDFHISPVVNPDGYEFSRTVNRLWRKTRSKHEILVNRDKIMCSGVDANRNFDYHWGSVDEPADDNVCSDGYAGPRTMSEPETRALASALRHLRPQLMAYLTLHSYGQMWLSPWGYAAFKPSSYQRQRDMALLAIDALQSVHGTAYSFGTVSDLLYPASGTSVDYAHSLNITYAYAVELRPGESSVGGQNPFRGFLQLEDQIGPTGQETFAALIAMTEAILNES